MRASLRFISSIRFVITVSASSMSLAIVSTTLLKRPASVPPLRSTMLMSRNSFGILTISANRRLPMTDLPLPLAPHMRRWRSNSGMLTTSP